MYCGESPRGAAMMRSPRPEEQLRGGNGLSNRVKNMYNYVWFNLGRPDLQNETHLSLNRLNENEDG